MSIEVMKQALNALIGWVNVDDWVWPETAKEQAKRNTVEAIAALRQAIELVEQAQPVAWMHLKRLLDSMRDESNAKANLNEWLRASPALVVKAAQAEDEWIKAAENLVAVQMAAQEYVASNTAPPPRKPLTDEEMDAALRRAGVIATYEALRCVGREVEAAHGIKEKNA